MTDEESKEEIRIERDEHDTPILHLDPEFDGMLGLDHVFLYERTGDVFRFKFKGMHNQEIRAVIVGCWLKLSDEDQADMIKELQAYQDPSETPSTMSRSLRDALRRHEGEESV